MRISRIALILAGSLAMSPGAVPAQPAPAAAAPAPADGKVVVAGIRRVLAENYVLPEMRPKLDAALARGLAQGRYDVTDPAILTERVNADLAAVANDKHLGLQYDPKGAAAAAAAPRGRDDDDDAPSAADLRRARLRNHGFTELKVLPGNIRYANMEGFVWAGPASAEAYDTAMRFLRDGEAVILDLRGNGGGSPDAVQYLVSHFMEPNRHLVTFHMGASQVDRLSTLPALPAGRMVGKPLYVLTGGHTASAAEEFAGHVAGFRLGELIGETTAGAGFRNSFFAVPGGYVLSVSVGRAVLASTGKDWEGVGIPPSTSVPAGKALDVARARALRRVAASASPEEKIRYEAMARVLDAQVQPVATALPLSAYAGRFGERTVSVEDGRLVYQRQGGPKLAMVAVGPNVFAFEVDPLGRVEYAVADGRAARLELIRSDGSRVAADRTP
jgi:hypothetical protein